MIDIEELFYNKIISEINKWHDVGIYAISFFVESNEAYQYNGFSNVSYFAISYNTESDCSGAGTLDEERWNYAFWRQDEIPIVDTYDDNDGAKQLFQWYAENGIKNIGYEVEDCYNENYEYIGKGPVGHYELMTIVSKIARRIQNAGIIVKKFGEPVPIIVHGLEYAWYDIEATKYANPNGEADIFLKAMRVNGIV